MSIAEHALARSITEVAPLIERGELRAVDLIDAQLARIAMHDGRLQAFAQVAADLAHAQARRADAELANGRHRGPLHGIPLALGDVIDVAGLSTACGSALLREHRPAQDAGLVEKLVAAGAVILGKLAVAEFALDTAPSPTRNPWRLENDAHGGAGAAVAACLCFGAVATDSGGGLRLAAANCGVTGFKPSFGRIARHGVLPLAATLDHVGALTRSADDVALLLAALEGHDARDMMSRGHPRSAAAPDSGLRVGIDRAWCAAAGPAQAEATNRACFMLKGQGIAIVDIELADADAAGAHWLTLCAVEALLVHRRWYPATAEAYGPAFRALLEHGTRLGAEDYARAQWTRQAVATRLDRVLDAVDAILTPTMPLPTPSPALLRYTAPGSLGGHPALSVPNGFSGDGLPLAMQFIGRRGDDATLLHVAAAYQRATGWHRRLPTLA